MDCGHVCPFAGSGASHVNRSNQQQYNNNDNDRIRWHDVVSIVEGGFGGVGNGGVDGVGVYDGRCMSDRGFKSSVGVDRIFNYDEHIKRQRRQRRQHYNDG